MRREGERMGLSAGLQGEHTAGADVPLQHQHPSRKTAILPMLSQTGTLWFAFPRQPQRQRWECKCCNQLLKRPRLRRDSAHQAVPHLGLSAPRISSHGGCRSPAAVG